MIIYNVTVSIDEDVSVEWLKWMKEKHIPDVLKVGIFFEARICRVLAEEVGEFTYAIQYTCHDMESYERYRDEFAPALQEDAAKHYGGKFTAFRTLLEVV